MAAASISLAEVTKRYGRTVAVDRLSLNIVPGSFTTLLGPSGCGKTTLLRLIAGFLSPDGGGIEIDGRSMLHLPAHKRPTATVFQEYALFPHMSVFENIAYGLRVRRFGEAEIRARVGAVADLLGIRGLEGRGPQMLSGGQQQRVALARALVVEPRVLLMDEPLSNLDARLRDAVRAELRALHQRLEITTIYVTHDQEEALFLSDWIAVMRSGRITQYGSPEEIYERPADPFVADFVGSVNFMEGTVLGHEDGHSVVGINGHTVRVQAPGRQVAPGRRVRLAVRPAALSLELQPPSSGNVLPGILRMSSYLGTTYRHLVAVAGSELTVDQMFEGPVPPGTTVYVVLPSQRSWIFPAEGEV